MSRPYTLADGQLATTQTSIVAGNDISPITHVDVIFRNTSVIEQDVVIFFRRTADGVVREFTGGTLKEDDQIIIAGLPLQPDDELFGYTTTADVVNYFVSSSRQEGLRVTKVSASGGDFQETELTMTGTLELSKAQSVESLLYEQNSLLRRILMGFEMMLAKL